MGNIKDLEQFREYLEGRVRPGTLDTYMSALSLFFASINGDRLTPAVAQSYIDSLIKSGKSPSTVSTRSHAIMRFFKWKGEKIQLDCPPIMIGDPKYLLKDKIDMIISACRTRLERVIVIVLFDSAIRISELLNLELGDIDWQEKMITVTRKGGRKDNVNIGDKTIKELEKWIVVRRSSSEKLFMDLTYYDVWRIIRRIGKRVGIDNLHPHVFRHSRAIHLLKNNVPINIVSQHLGHRSITTTINIYGRFMAKDYKDKITPM